MSSLHIGLHLSVTPRALGGNEHEAACAQLEELGKLGRAFPGGCGSEGTGLERAVPSNPSLVEQWIHLVERKALMSRKQPKMAGVTLWSRVRAPGWAFFACFVSPAFLMLRRKTVCSPATQSG
eukprot:scaffold155678_cov33-Tisochrysis_lutea.AAC.1